MHVLAARFARLASALVAGVSLTATLGCGADRSSRSAATPKKYATDTGYEGGDTNTGSSTNASDPSMSKPVGGATPAGTTGCENAAGVAFVRCLDAMYEARQYAQMIRVCEAALKTPHSDIDKATVAETCITLLPPALWIGGERKDSVSLVAAACEKATDEKRVDRAARETLILLRGMSKSGGTDDEKKSSVKEALVAYATSCQVEPERVAKRVLELGKDKD